MNYKRKNEQEMNILVFFLSIKIYLIYLNCFFFKYELWWWFYFVDFVHCYTLYLLTFLCATLRNTLSFYKLCVLGSKQSSNQICTRNKGYWGKGRKGVRKWRNSHIRKKTQRRNNKDCLFLLGVGLSLSVSLAHGCFMRTTD